MAETHEPWFERLIREAEEAGEFDDLPGKGRPIDDLHRPYDPAWWARSWLAREAVAEEARDVAGRVRREVPRILAGDDEAAMAGALERLNLAIADVNRRLAEPDRLPLLEVAALISGRASRPDS